MMHSLMVQNIDVPHLKTLLKEVVQEQLELFKESSSKADDELLTREETCKFLKVDQSTLWAWTKKGKIVAHGIGHRRYYKKEDVLAALKPKSV